MPVRLATLDDVPKLAPMLAGAFVDDPFLCWLVKKNLDRFFHAELTQVALPKKHVFITDALDAAALWFPPGGWKMGLIDEAKQLPSLLGCIGGLRRIVAVAQGVGAVQRVRPKEPHWYLYILGVDPTQQGKGLGATLMQPTLDRCDREGVGAYLETATPRAMHLYRRHGFEVRDQVQVPHGGPLVFTMWRPPRAR